MGIDVAPITVAWIFFVIGFSIITYLIGGFVQWDKRNEQVKALKSDLLYAYQEAEDLREVIQSCACRSKCKPSVTA
jgi:3-mercaptopyruvate sulfurtransferase SseA